MADLDELLDAQGQLLRAERLGEVGVGALPQPFQPAFMECSTVSSINGICMPISTGIVSPLQTHSFRHHHIRDDQAGDQSSGFFDPLCHRRLP